MTNSLKFGVVMDPIASISFKKDTTLALLLAAQAAGHHLYYMEINDLFLDQGIAYGMIKELQVYENENQWFSIGPPSTIPLSALDAILMRKDPPFNNQYIYATYILEAAEKEGCVVVNKPQSLRDCNEKIFASLFPQCCPPLLVSRNINQLKQFFQQHHDVIFKPLDGMGGSGIFRCKPGDPNVTVILEMLTRHGREFIMGQKYVPEITEGDKRVLVINGEAIPYCLARIPAQGETRGNLAAGGTGVAKPLSQRDWWIVNQVAPTLVQKGLIFVGLDIIGDFLTEINVTSPTCAREIDRAYNTNIGGKLIDSIEKLCAKR